ncbi:hypothetical protein LC608_27660 [Nostoc sp. XA010]|uniref:hypothetical protein n=1 Tax=Nostoc sp. XA010 TaxID=2780407 RepID=UPI001E644A50|nr:hypothetical protein [Nostoc sp. XA010]MCC5660686.1 hypothetical protein [Nostoc sp. XA010]
MASTYFVDPSSEKALAVAQNLAILNEKIAILIRETATKTTTKQEVFYFLASHDGARVIFKNEKKVLKELTIDLAYGLEFDPRDKNGKLQLDIVNLLCEISRDPHMIDVSLGLKWLQVAFIVFGKVHMRATSVVSVDIVTATLQDWMDTIKATQLEASDKIEIAIWLLDRSKLGRKLNASDRKKLETFVKSLEPVAITATVPTVPQ